MTTTYNWTLGPLEAEDDGALNKVVRCVHWQVTGEAGDHSGQAYGTRVCDAPGESFTAWSDLTPEIVKGWLPEAVIDDAEAAVQKVIDQKIAAAAKNKTAGVPWA